jgi:hypothetical protein
LKVSIDHVSLVSLVESIGKIEANPKEEASVVEVFQDVLDKLSDVGNRPPNNFLPNQTNWKVDGEYLIST